ncbi:hypothetical protein L3N51_00073 [Metallosphaera sp. J1]|uniref:hypothetical protein n=1 Tax=Metallosphaera javensis (ex Hofmann et al. 2022) TaxID=99938 RepID=UPI001EDF4D52|nr:hypothetical protein [Metallosphaera javensis (ex Hofmann et al. 2022)]MCG3107808.1 hypothetical protein [Metallosphaera javensis (ex Hofmann et al. 2022)]
MSLLEQKEQLVQAESTGDLNGVIQAITAMNREFNNFIYSNRALESVAFNAIAMARVGSPFTYVTNNDQANEEARCNGKTEGNMRDRFNVGDRKYMKLAFVSIASDDDIAAQVVSKPVQDSPKLVFRQGVMVRLMTPSGKELMVYIGGISPEWRGDHVSVYQYGAERRFKFSSGVRSGISSVLSRLNIGVLFGAERASQVFVNPPSPEPSSYSAFLQSYRKDILEDSIKKGPALFYKTPTSHGACNACTSIALSASSNFPDLLPAFSTPFVPFIGQSYYLVPGYPENPIDEYYLGSPVYAGNSNCDMPAIVGFISSLIPFSQALQAYSQLQNRSVQLNKDLESQLNQFLSSSSVAFVLSPPRSWSYDDVIQWSYSLGYSQDYVSSAINFAVVLGTILSQYPEDVVDDLEKELYKHEFSCSNPEQCYSEMNKIAQDIYNVLVQQDWDKELEALQICHAEATILDQTCYWNCVDRVYESLRRLPLFDRLHLSPSSNELRSDAQAQCRETCTKFNEERYLECLRQIYPSKVTHPTL